HRWISWSFLHAASRARRPARPRGRAAGHAAGGSLHLPRTVMDYAINKIGNQWGRDYDVVTGLPRPIQLVFALRRMKNEIDGDGLQHLLEEEESWQYAGLALEGYRRV